jgi:hypothetical protein
MNKIWSPIDERHLPKLLKLCKHTPSTIPQLEIKHKKYFKVTNIKVILFIFFVF